MANGTGGEWGNRLRAAVWVLAVGLFLLPLVAMQFTAEVKWTGFDFLVWGVMLLVACGAYELVSRMSPDRHYRLGAGAAVAGGFLVFWANGAVGMVGDGPNAYNLLFLAAIAVGALLAFFAWFRPAGMARALFATAAIHGAVALAALALDPDKLGAALSLCFALPYLVAAGLFRMAARETAAA
jgi:low temperature requirement protein LtrA